MKIKVLTDIIERILIDRGLKPIRLSKNDIILNNYRGNFNLIRLEINKMIPDITYYKFDIDGKSKIKIVEDDEKFSYR